MIAKLRELKSGLERLPSTVITGDKMRMFRNVIDRELGFAKYGVEVWGAGTAIGKLPMSKKATQALNDGHKADLTVEHTIPVSVLYQSFAIAETDAEFQAVIDHYHVALVTKEENKAINRAYVGAQSRMPTGWKMGDAILARYVIARLELEANES